MEAIVNYTPRSSALVIEKTPPIIVITTGCTVWRVKIILELRPVKSNQFIQLHSAANYCNISYTIKFWTYLTYSVHILDIYSATEIRGCPGHDYEDFWYAESRIMFEIDQNFGETCLLPLSG